VAAGFGYCANTKGRCCLLVCYAAEDDTPSLLPVRGLLFNQDIASFSLYSPVVCVGTLRRRTAGVTLTLLPAHACSRAAHPPHTLPYPIPATTDLTPPPHTARAPQAPRACTTRHHWPAPHTPPTALPPPFNAVGQALQRTLLNVYDACSICMLFLFADAASSRSPFHRSAAPRAGKRRWITAAWRHLPHLTPFALLPQFTFHLTLWRGRPVLLLSCRTFCTGVYHAALR